MLYMCAEKTFHEGHHYVSWWPSPCLLIGEPQLVNQTPDMNTTYSSFFSLPPEFKGHFRLNSRSKICCFYWHNNSSFYHRLFRLSSLSPVCVIPCSCEPVCVFEPPFKSFSWLMIKATFYFFSPLLSNSCTIQQDDVFGTGCPLVDKLLKQYFIKNPDAVAELSKFGSTAAVTWTWSAECLASFELWRSTINVFSNSFFLIFIRQWLFLQHVKMYFWLHLDGLLVGGSLPCLRHTHIKKHPGLQLQFHYQNIYFVLFSIKTLAAIFNKTANGQVPQSSSYSHTLAGGSLVVCGHVLGFSAAVWMSWAPVGVGRGGRSPCWSVSRVFHRLQIFLFFLRLLKILPPYTCGSWEILNNSVMRNSAVLSRKFGVHF